MYQQMATTLTWTTAMGQSQSRWNAEPSHSPPQMVKNSPLVDLHSIVLHIIFVALLESSDLPSRSSFFKINLWVLHICPLSRVSIWSSLAILAALAAHPLSPQRESDEGASFPQSSCTNRSRLALFFSPILKLFDVCCLSSLVLNKRCHDCADIHILCS